MSNRSTVLSARMWILVLLDGAERIGIAPLSVERLHRLIYLANAMAPVYDLLAPDGYILKYKRGPFFPAVQWDVDRMSVQGLIKFVGFDRYQDEYGWWFEANYSLTSRGHAAVDFALELDGMARRASFLREVVRAFAAVLRSEGVTAAEADASLLQDIGYARADPEAAVDFRLVARNLTARATSGIGQRLAEADRPARRAQLHLYFRYLEHAWRSDEAHASA